MGPGKMVGTARFTLYFWAPKGRVGRAEVGMRTHHTAPAAPDTVVTTLLKELDDVELVVVGADVGLVQGAVIVPIDLQRVTWPGLAPGSVWGRRGSGNVPVGTQRGVQGNLGLTLCQQGRNCSGSPPTLPPLPLWVPEPCSHLGVRCCAQGAQPINFGWGLLLGSSFQGCQGGAPGVILLFLFQFLFPAVRLLRGRSSALGSHDRASPLPRGQGSLNPPEKPLETAEGAVREAELSFRQNPGCALLSVCLQPSAGLEEGMGPLPTNCPSLVPLFRVGGRASERPSALEGPQSRKSPVTQSQGGAQGVSAACTANWGQKSWERTRVCWRGGGACWPSPPLTRNPQSTGVCPQGSLNSLPQGYAGKQTVQRHAPSMQCYPSRHAMPAPQSLSRAMTCFDLGMGGLGQPLFAVCPTSPS